MVTSKVPGDRLRIWYLPDFPTLTSRVNPVSTLRMTATSPAFAMPASAPTGDWASAMAGPSTSAASRDNRMVLVRMGVTSSDGGFRIEQCAKSFQARHARRPALMVASSLNAWGLGGIHRQGAHVGGY